MMMTCTTLQATSKPTLFTNTFTYKTTNLLHHQTHPDCFVYHQDGINAAGNEKRVVVKLVLVDVAYWRQCSGLQWFVNRMIATEVLPTHHHHRKQEQTPNCRLCRMRWCCRRWKLVRT
jgi:hypothetical protein